MAFTRKYGRKKYGRKKVYKRRSFNHRRGIRTRKNGSKVFYIKRTTVQEFTITNAGWQPAQSSFSILNSWSLSDIDSYAEFTALFDNYKIGGISQKWVFSKTSAEIGTTAEVPNLITIKDNNDANDMATEAEGLQYPSYKSSSLNKPRTRYTKPTANYTKVVYGPKSNWISTTEPNIVHYGCKWAIDTTDATTGTTYGICRLYTKFYLAFKDPK